MSVLSTLEATIKADLSAGESWFEAEALQAGTALWNILKGAFIALEPQEGQILLDVLTAAVTAATSGATIEMIETAALNTVVLEEKAVLQKVGSGILQVLIAGIKAVA